MVAEYTGGSVAPALQLIPGGKLGDEWALGGDYSLDEVFMRGSDKQGHSERPRVSLPPHLWAEACTIVATGRTPYNTAVDMIRDGLYHRMHYWRDKLPELDWRQFDTQEALAAADRRMAKMIALDALVDANREILESAMTHGAYGMLNEGIEEVETLAAAVADQPWHGLLIDLAAQYRRRYETQRAITQ